MIPRRVSSTAACLVLVFTSACSKEITTPAGEVMLESLLFASAEVRVGDPLVVVGRTAGSASIQAQPLVVRTSSGEHRQASLIPLPSGERDPWRRLSDVDLAAVIRTWENCVVIGFKEAGTEKGVDDFGRNITSAETVERMREWLRQQGVTITEQSILLPAVFGTVDAEPTLVRAVRNHLNIDYLNPACIPGWPEASLGASSISVVYTTPDAASSLRVRAGDLVTAEYRQPDRSVLRATTSVR